MDDKPKDINSIIQRLQDELALQVECEDDSLAIACDIQELINRYLKIEKAWTYLNEVNDHNMAHIRDLKEEIKILNCKLADLRDCVD